jgi:hypothetical protein
VRAVRAGPIGKRGDVSGVPSVLEPFVMLPAYAAPKPEKKTAQNDENGVGTRACWFGIGIPPLLTRNR